MTPARLNALAEADNGVVDAPPHEERSPEWKAIGRVIDQFVGRVPTVSKHRAVNGAYIAEVVARLDADGDHAAADTIVWLCWHTALDRERERFLQDYADEQITALRARARAMEGE